MPRSAPSRIPRGAQLTASGEGTWCVRPKLFNLPVTSLEPLCVETRRENLFGGKNQNLGAMNFGADWNLSGSMGSSKWLKNRTVCESGGD